MTIQHSPLPWGMEKPHPWLMSGGPAIRTPSRHIARLGWNNPEDIANAEFIILAVNAHDGLLAALRESADVMAKLLQSARIEGRTERENYARHGVDTARAAIAKAERKEA